jgi:hypothetical protein
MVKFKFFFFRLNLQTEISSGNFSNFFFNSNCCPYGQPNGLIFQLNYKILLNYQLLQRQEWKKKKKKKVRASALKITKGNFCCYY